MAFWARIARFVVIALFFLIPLANGGVQGWAITTMHLITLLALILFLIDRIHRWQWRWIRTSLDLPVAALLIMCLLAVFFSQNRWNSGWALLLCLNYVVLYYLMIHLFQTRSEVRLLMVTMVGSALLVTIIGGLTWWGIHPFDWWRFEGIPHDASSMRASFGNRNHFAGFMALSLPLALAGGLLVFRSWARFLCLGATLLIAGGLILSLSRGGWLAGVCGCSFLLVWLSSSRLVSKRKLFLAFCIILLAGLLIVFSNTPVVMRLITLLRDPIQAFAGRMRLWSAVWEMIADYPILGIGPGNFGTVFTQYHPPGMMVQHIFAENDYLHWTAEIGVGAIVLIGWIMVAIFIKAIQKQNHPSRLVAGVTAGAFSGLVAIGVKAMVDFPFHIPAIALMATGMAALVTAPDAREY